MTSISKMLYSTIICTVLLAAGIKASENWHATFANVMSEEEQYPILRKRLDVSHTALPSSSFSFDVYNLEKPEYNTAQELHEEDAHSIESVYSPNYCYQNAQEYAGSFHHTDIQHLAEREKPIQNTEEILPCEIQGYKEPVACMSNNLCTEDANIDNRSETNKKIQKIRKQLRLWNSKKLHNAYRNSLYMGYIPMLETSQAANRKYNVKKERLYSNIETYVVQWKNDVHNAEPIKTELWFAIASRTSYMHTKLAEYKLMRACPSKYKCIEGLNGYYPGVLNDLVWYIEKYGPLVSDQNSVKTEWTETLGDIYVRKPIESVYAIDRGAIIYNGCGRYKHVSTVVRMILALSEVYKDLFNLTVEFIYNTLREETDSKHLTVVRALHTIVEKYNSSKQLEIDKQYEILCNIFIDILQQTYASYESIVVRLYAEMYKSITYFYEKAEVCEEVLDIEKKRRKDEKGKEYYLLAGKCIIKPQRYIKCTTTIDLNKPASEYLHQITEEIDRWNIPSDVQKHYHIHYVDNTKQQYTRVCMPMYLDGYIHTISQIVEYLKKIYSIEKDECVCPYKRDMFGYWRYIQEEERDKTVNEFTNCDVVFYYIEEGLRENYFTFAEFESHRKPKGETVRIPLFLSPLMHSAVYMGPFKEIYKIQHTVVDNMQSMNREPNVYTYEEKYKTLGNSDIHHYYSNMYIRRDDNDAPTIDCYTMICKASIDNNTITVEWHAKVNDSVDAYTHCILNDELRNDQNKYDAFIDAMKSQEYTPDSILYGFGLESSRKKTSTLDMLGHGSNYYIDQSQIDCLEITIVPINNIYINPNIFGLRNRIDKLNREIKQVRTKEQTLTITENQKIKLQRKRKSIYMMKSRKKQKPNEIQLYDQPHMKKKHSGNSFPPCAFLVFRHSNTHTKSNLGAHNEILDALARRHNFNRPF